MYQYVVVNVEKQQFSKQVTPCQNIEIKYCMNSYRIILFITTTSYVNVKFFEKSDKIAQNAK